MPARKAAAAAAPRTVLQRHTVRLASKSVGMLGFLVQSVADGEDIYELAAQHAARSAAMKKRTRRLVERETRGREQQQPKHIEEVDAEEKEKAGEKREHNVKAGGQQSLHDSAPVSADGAEIYVLSNGAASTCTSEQHDSAAEAATVEVAVRAAAAEGIVAASITSSAAAADVAKSVSSSSSSSSSANVTACHDDVKDILPAKAPREDPTSGTSRCSGDTAAAAAAAAAAALSNASNAFALQTADLDMADAEQSNANSGATTTGTSSSSNITAVETIDCTNDAATRAASPCNQQQSVVPAFLIPPLPALSNNNTEIQKKRPTRASASTSSISMTALAPAPPPCPPAEKAPVRKATKRKRGGTKRLTLMPGSPVFGAAERIRRWRDWCIGEYEKRTAPDTGGARSGVQQHEDHRSDDVSVTIEVAPAEGGDEEGEPAAEPTAAFPSSSLPHYSAFDSLDSTIAAARDAGVFNDMDQSGEALNRDTLKCALVGIIKAGDHVECIRIPSKMKRYQSQVMGQKRYLTTGQDQIGTFRSLLGDESNYPLYITYCRRVVVPPQPPVDLTGDVRAGSKRAHPVEDFDAGPAKRRRTSRSGPAASTASAARKPAPPSPKEDEVICLLDSSDDEEVEEEKTESMEVSNGDRKAATESRKEPDGIVVMKNENESAPAARTQLVKALPMATPDPIAVFHADDFVLTKYGPGKVLCTRIDRILESDELLVRPILTYAIDLRCGIIHVPSTEVKAIEGSEYTETRILTYYEGITLNKMDKLRLWPLTYLNDSLVNFYVKYLVKEKLATVGTSLSNDDFHIFPTYFYSRMSYLENGGTAYRDTKSSRQKLYQDLKGWTKKVDIFEKRVLILPINYDLHWTFVLVANPGDVLRVIPPPPPSKPSVGTEVEANKVDDTAVHIEQRISPSNNEDEVTAILEPSAPNVSVTEAPGTVEMNGGIHIQADMHGESTNPPSTSVPSAGFTVVYPDVHSNSPSPRSTLPPSSRSTSASSDDGTKSSDCSGDDVVSVVHPEKAEEEVLLMENAPTSAPVATSDRTLAPCLIHFDSGKHFKLHRSATIFKNIRKYLAACYESTKSEEFPLCSISAKTMPGFAPPIPQQMNAKDCGVYTLEMIERVLCSPLDVDAAFVEKRGAVEGSQLNNKWFTSEDIAQKRLNMLQLIAKIEAEYEPNLV